MHFPAIRKRSGVICETLLDEWPCIEVTNNQRDHTCDMITLDKMRNYKSDGLIIECDLQKDKKSLYINNISYI